MKRILTLALACFLLFSAVTGLVACGTDTESSDGGTASATVGETTPATDAPPEESQDSAGGEIVNPTDKSDLPDDLKFTGETVKFIYVDLVGKKDELVSDGSDSLISEAVLTRNSLLETQLGITMECVPNTGDDVAEKLKQDVLTEDGEYDIVVNGTYKSVTPALDGYYVNLSDVPYLNTTKDYWTQGFNDMVTFGGKQYLATGSASISLYRYVFLTLYDQTAMNDRHLPDLYDTVKNYEWTLDTQWSLI